MRLRQKEAGEAALTGCVVAFVPQDCRDTEGDEPPERPPSARGGFRARPRRHRYWRPETSLSISSQAGNGLTQGVLPSPLLLPQNSSASRASEVRLGSTQPTRASHRHLRGGRMPGSTLL